MNPFDRFEPSNAKGASFVSKLAFFLIRTLILIQSVLRLGFLFISEKVKAETFLKRKDYEDMRKSLLLVLFVNLLLVLASCAKGTPNDLSNTEQSFDVFFNQQSYMTGICNKNNVEDFMSVLGKQEMGGYVLDKEHCFNVTSERIAEETPAQIFKFSNSCATFLYLDDQVYPLGEWFGGYGLVNAVPCDFDQDGNTDILYTYSCGSGVHRSFVAIFNTATKENTVIYYDSSTTDNPLVDLYVGTQSPSIPISDAEPPTYFVIYTVRIEVLENNFANLGCVATGIVGSVESENGIPVFRPAS